MQHRRLRPVKASDFAGVGREGPPRTCGGIGSLEPFRRGIIVVATEAVAAAIALTDLEARVKYAIRLQRAPYALENAGQFVTRHVQEAGAGPHAVIGLPRVEFVEPHGVDALAEASRGDRGHLRRAVGRADLEA